MQIFHIFPYYFHFSQNGLARPRGTSHSEARIGQEKRSTTDHGGIPGIARRSLV